MNFLHPGLALAAVMVAALPVLLHLLLRRPRSTAWPSTLLLQRAMDRMRRRRHMDRWLLLLLRVAALLLLGLGMAGPFVSGGSSGQGARRLWIVIDDGATSAERIETSERGLDRSVRKAIDLIDGLAEGDQVGVVAAGRPVRVLVQPTADLQRARRVLQELEPRAVPTDLPAAVTLTIPPAEDPVRTEVLLATGWRRGAVRGGEAALAAVADGARRVRWIAMPPIERTADNRSIASATVERAVNQALDPRDRSIRISLARAGARPTAQDGLQVALPSGEVIAQGQAPWPADADGTSSTIMVRQSEAGAATVSLSPDAQPLDDTMPVIWEPNQQPRVWLVGRSGDEGGLERTSASTWILRAIESSGLSPQVVDPASLALRSAKGVDVIVVSRPDLVDSAGWAWLGRFVDDGGAMLLMPAADRPEQGWFVDASRPLRVDLASCGSAQAWTGRLAATQPRSALLSLLGAEVDQLAEPVQVTRRLDLTSLAPAAEAVLRFEDGSPAMLMIGDRARSGTLLMLAMPPDLGWTDLPLKPLMVPLMQETVRAAMSMTAHQRRLPVSQIASLGPSAGDGVLLPAMAHMGPAVEIDPDGRSRSPVPTPGLWKLRRKDGSETWYAVRLDPADADIGATDRADLLPWAQALGDWRWTDEPETGIEAGARTESPWTWLLLTIALLCLLVETPWSRRGSPRRTPQVQSA